jgi:two-component system KDP operon response regulator KdpE
VITTGEFTIDLVAKKVLRGGEPVHLTPTEWAILDVLARNHGRLVSQRQLLHDVRGPSYTKEAGYLRVYLTQLRRKLEPARPAAPSHHEPGMAYRFEP